VSISISESEVWSLFAIMVIIDRWDQREPSQSVVAPISVGVRTSTYGLARRIGSFSATFIRAYGTCISDFRDLYREIGDGVLRVWIDGERF
jgi:hypothetical protein